MEIVFEKESFCTKFFMLINFVVLNKMHKDVYVHRFIRPCQSILLGNNLGSRAKSRIGENLIIKSLAFPPSAQQQPPSEIFFFVN